MTSVIFLQKAASVPVYLPSSTNNRLVVLALLLNERHQSSSKQRRTDRTGPGSVGLLYHHGLQQNRISGYALLPWSIEKENPAEKVVNIM